MIDSTQIEQLESRRLLSGASVFRGVLRVYGDLVNNNEITIANSSDGLNVDVTIRTTNRSHVSTTLTKSFPKKLGFTRLNVWGGLRADTVNIAQTNGAIGLRARIDTLRGDDTINAGDENDLIYAGLGKDSVTSAGGADLVYGGGGDDVLNTGEGNDTAWGGNGNDAIDTGNGDDKLGGVLGANTLTGGAGHDTFVVQSLAANPTNDFNQSEDTLVTTGDNGDVDAPPGA